ncbi:hypothetical protein RV18_GL000070 [Enterococcus termitis]|nr:hypothetical protein RV18_GL000070 [Enterococcus termitis]
MKKMTTQLTEKTIKGKRIRTNNQRIEEIIALWSEVPAMNIAGDLYAVYSNYETNFKGDYDLLIGSEQADLQDEVKILAGEYVAIPVAEGTPEGVGKAWQKIWQDEALEKRRTYRTDIEHYQKDGTVTIFLSI